MNRFDADAKFRRAVALEQVEKPAPSQRVKSYSHTSQYEHSSDVGFVTSTSDHFAAGVTIEELLDVSRDAAAVTVWPLSGVIGLLLQVLLLAVVVVVVVFGGLFISAEGNSRLLRHNCCWCCHRILRHCRRSFDFCVTRASARA